MKNKNQPIKNHSVIEELLSYLIFKIEQSTSFFRLYDIIKYFVTKQRIKTA